MNMDLVNIAIENIKLPSHARRNYGNLSSLEASIKKIGLLAPVLVNQDNVLLSGTRRLEACKNIGVPEIAALRVDVAADSMLALDILSDENLCRQDFTQEELENQISAKQALLGSDDSPAGKTTSKIRNFFRRLFASDE